MKANVWILCARKPNTQSVQGKRGDAIADRFLRFPVTDKRYRLSELSEAIRYLEQRHARGKVIIILSKKNKT